MLITDPKDERMIRINNILFTMQTHRLGPGDIELLRDSLRAALTSLAEKDAQLCRAREALKFYATDSNWNNDIVDIGVREQGIPDSSECVCDSGAIAIAALSSTGPCPLPTPRGRSGSRSSASSAL